MPTESTWDPVLLESRLMKERSYAKVAPYYGVSRQRVHAVAVKLLGAERCRDLVKGAHHKYSECVECHRSFTKRIPHAARGLCVLCYRPITYRERKARQQDDPQMLERVNQMINNLLRH